MPNPPFGGSPLTPNQAFDPSKDHTTPNLRGLNPNGMSSAGALSGTTGIDCKLIHGDRWQEIQGKLTENIKNDLTTHILEKQKWTVDEDLNFTVTGETTENFVGEAKQYFHSGSRFEYFGEHTDLHHDHDHQINPTHTFDILDTEGEYKNVEIAVTASAFEAIGTSVEATVAKAEAWGAGAEAWGAQVGAGAFHNEAVALDVGEHEADHKMDLVKGRLDALEAEAGGPRTIIRPVRIGICIAVHIDSPWA
jgi:hypothetical protein